jgi:integrase
MAQKWKSDDGTLAVFDRGDGRSPWLFGKAKHPTNGRWVYFSTETDDVTAAVAFSLKKQGEINILAKHNVEVSSPNFPRAANIYKDKITKLLPKGKLKLAMSEIDRFLVGFFKDKPLNKILNSDIEAYREWRKTYWLTGPGSEGLTVTYLRGGKKITTVMKYKRPASRRAITYSLYLLKQILLMAQDNGWIKALPELKLPKVSNKKKDLEPYFTLEEIPKLYEAILHWEEKRRKWLDRAYTDPVKRMDRDIYVKHLFVFVHMLLGSGMRPGTETESLRISSFVHRKVMSAEEEGTRHPLYEARISGKVGSRSAVISTRASNVLMMWFDVIKAQVKEADPYIFSTTKGPIKETTTAGMFERVLKKYGLLYDPKGRKRTLYALRRSYATNMLITRPNLSYARLAHQMGTSTQMLDKHYVQPLSHILNAHEFVSGF